LNAEIEIPVHSWGEKSHKLDAYRVTLNAFFLAVSLYPSTVNRHPSTFVAHSYNATGSSLLFSNIELFSGNLYWNHPTTDA
jgi:hypothetical protein